MEPQKPHLVDQDLMERIRREARHKKMDHRVLLNRYLRDALFKSKREKQDERFLDRPFCPACGHDFRKGRPKKEQELLAKSLTKKSWRNWWGLRPRLKAKS